MLDLFEVLLVCIVVFVCACARVSHVRVDRRERIGKQEKTRESLRKQE